jgi:hypothetical protein
VEEEAKIKVEKTRAMPSFCTTVCCAYILNITSGDSPYERGWGGEE